MNGSSFKKKNFVVLTKETIDADKIKNFFMNSYSSKTGIFVKLMREASMKVQHSTRLRGENWLKIKVLSWNSLARYRNCRKQFINFVNDSRDVQDAESVRSQPVSFPPHPVPGGMLSRSLGMPSRREGPPSIWDSHGISGNVFANPAVSSSAPFPKELNL